MNNGAMEVKNEKGKGCVMVKQEKDHIYDRQIAFFGGSETIGFGDINNIYIKEIEREKANKIIIENHYSHKVFNLSTIHLGIYVADDLVGAMQYGYAMNPSSGASIVEGTTKENFLELNRLWIRDDAPKYIESQAISYSIKYIKKKFPDVKWLQSFADERCNKFGIVYQACNFGYFGEHVNIFWELDGVVYHNIEMTVTPLSKRYSSTSEKIQKRKHEATRLTLRQFRYLFFIDKRWERKCTLEKQPYPKHYKKNEESDGSHGD